MILSNTIAIVGIGNIFPQSSGNQQFWHNIVNNINTSKEVPKDRWPIAVDDAYNPAKGVLDSAYSKHCCLVDKFTLDTEGIDIDRDLINELDPMFHLGLHAAKNAFFDSNYKNINRSKTGVIIGNIVLPTEKSSRMAMEYLGHSIETQVLGKKFSAADGTVNPTNRFVAGLPAGLIAKALELGGGTFTLDAACASSLYAISLAADELLSGRADAMITGGLSRPDCFYTQMGFSQLHALSPTGISSPFDVNANGLVTGEGAGMFLLKRLSDALYDNDHIYATLKGVGLSNDVGGSLLAPNSEGQLRAMKEAYKRAGWSPNYVDIIECHATGTPVGDAVEFASLKKLWCDEGWDKGQCILGSVKSNIGHLLTAAGSAGLTKILLAMQEKRLPPTANFSRAGEKIDFKDTPFKILKETESWEQRKPNIPRRAAVSAFGFGGINAHLLVEEWLPEHSGKLYRVSVPSKIRNNKPIAIVGMDAHFGQWDSLELFKERVFGGRRSDTPSTDANHPFTGYFVKKISVAKNNYRIPPKELEEMQPQQLLMLKVAGDAIKDAAMNDNDRLTTGIFIGIGLDLNTTNFHMRWLMADKAKEWAKFLNLNLDNEEMDRWIAALRNTVGKPLTANSTLGSLGSMVASRIAREFHIGGPSFTISSEETSGNSALETAIRLLQKGRITNAVVGAVDFTNDIRSIVGTDFKRKFEKDKNALGEGAAAVILKPLEDALKDGDRVYAVIKGAGRSCSTNADTHVPEKQGYLNALERAYKDAEVSPSSIDMLEIHGSGFSEEDKMELDAIKEYFNEQSNPLVLSTVTADTGYTGAASGLTSLVKIALCLYHEILPCSNNHQGISLDNSRFFFPDESQYWLHDKADGERKVGLTTLSMDGNCTHVVMEGYSNQTPSEDRSRPLGSHKYGLFSIEADRINGLSEELRSLKSLCKNSTNLNVDKLALVWWQKNGNNNEKRYGLAFVTNSRDELLNLLAQTEKAIDSGTDITNVPGPNNESIFYSETPLKDSGKIAFIFPGSGNCYHGMGRELSTCMPELLRRQQKENNLLKSQYNPMILWNQTTAEEPEIGSHDALLAQVTTGTLFTDAVTSFGIKPDAVIGYSLGETVGLFSTHTWTDRDEMFKRIAASDLFIKDLAGDYNAAKKTWGLSKNQKANWIMGVVNLPENIVKKSIGNREKVYLLIVNTTTECVIGGDKKAVEELVISMDCSYFPLDAITIAHCEIVNQVEKAYRDLHLFPVTAPYGITFYSGALGDSYKVTKKTAADSISAHATKGIHYPRLIEKAYKDGIRIFIEIGPGASCTRMIKKILGNRPHMAKSASILRQSEMASILRLIGQLIAERVSVDLSGLYGKEEMKVQKDTELLTLKTVREPFKITLPPAQTSTQKSRSKAYLNNGENDIINAFTAAMEARAKAHQTYLIFSQNLTRTMEQNMALQISMMKDSPEEYLNTTVNTKNVMKNKTDVAFNREKCMEFAIGKIGDILGKDYAEVDNHPTRVRLPDEPLMLVDRIISVHGKPLSLTNGRVITEHDIRSGSWYLDNGKIPTCIAVEAGQADLFLSGYLGIDLKTKGLAVYRLLDAIVTFQDELPGHGKTIHYDIQINQFFRQGETYLFRFNFDATVDGKPLLTMKDGCAGFFTEGELAAGKGIIENKLEKKMWSQSSRKKIIPIVPVEYESYSKTQINALRSGDLAGCFGKLFKGLQISNPYGIPGGKMTLVDRVTDLNPKGGRYESGVIRAEADIHPDDWFLTCHFIDDKVMPGTLMYECCMHTLRIYLLRSGWVGEKGDVVFQPLPGVSSRLKCRGQVTEFTKTVVYEVSIKEIGYEPEPYAIADALMYADGKPIVEISNMSVRFTGLSLKKLQDTWNERKNDKKKKIIFEKQRILDFATGKPSDAFGEPYKIFDTERKIARLPGPPYQFLDRITKISAQPWELVAGGEVEAEYDIPEDAWYFKENRQKNMPFSILLEVALQPCGWLAAYLGSALTSETDLKFRNLGGTATQHAPVTPKTGTLTTTVKMTKVSQSAGMIIQNYDLSVCSGDQQIYSGDTYFGFFAKAALEHQVGIRSAEPYTPKEKEIKEAKNFPYPTSPPYPASMMRMIDSISLYSENGGNKKLGYIKAIKQVNPEEWFFKAHFYEDPVCPGSLGLESYLQLLKVVAHKRWGNKVSGQIDTVTINKKHSWVYRGQIIPSDNLVTVHAEIIAIDDINYTIQANGFLTVDGRVIYQMNDFGIQLQKTKM